MVQALVLLVFLGLIQLAYGLYLRNSLIDVASAASRRAALVGGNEDEGKRRALELISRSFGHTYPARVTVTKKPVEVAGSGGTGAEAGATVGQVDAAAIARVSPLDRGVWQSVTVRIEAPLPLLGPIGPSGGVVATATTILPGEGRNGGTGAGIGEGIRSGEGGTSGGDDSLGSRGD